MEYIHYLLTKQEQDQNKKLKDTEEKRIFLRSFWEKHDLSPQTSINEYRLAYLQCVKSAHQRFSSYGEGWKSDMGRVFILYGEPVGIEQMTFSELGRASQIWKYERIEGGVIFVFVDLLGIKKYQLVHSTLLGEVHDYNWQNLLTP